MRVSSQFRYYLGYKGLTIKEGSTFHLGLLLLGKKRETALSAAFSKITPSLFTLKEGSTSHPDPLSSGAREETALLGAQNRFALRLADHQRSSPYFAGWDRLAVAGGDLMLLQSHRHVVRDGPPGNSSLQLIVIVYD